MDFKISIQKNDNEYRIDRVRNIADLQGAYALISVTNNSGGSIQFPCEYLEAQGVWNTYDVEGRPEIAPRSVPLAPVDAETKSHMITLSPGESCHVKQFIEPSYVERFLDEIGKDKVRVRVSYIIPEDDVFGEIAGRSKEIHLDVSR